MQSENGRSYLPIKKSDLLPHTARATQIISKVTFKSNRAAQAQAVIPGQPTTFRHAPTSGQEETRSLLVFAKAISDDALLLTDAANHVLSTVRTGITVGSYLANQYGSAAGLDLLSQLNGQRKLTPTQTTEFQAKQSTAAAIATFALASYVLWELGAYEVEKVDGVKMPGAESPELYLVNYFNAVDCTMLGLCKFVQDGGLVTTDIQMVKATILYFEAVIRELKLKEKSFAYSEFFTGVSYRLVDTEFRVKGFEEQSSTLITVTEFNPVRFDQIVGNRAAKHEAKRLSQRIVCYDPIAKKNPFMVIGGFAYVCLGKGFPGTGKSLQIAATATLMKEYCERIGLPFAFHPMPQTMVSTYQGGTSLQMHTYMRQAHNTGCINYMPADDAEALFEDRTREGVSEGVKGVIQIFLTETEGASAPRFGNSVIQLFTNLPEILDAAVLSRATNRFSVDGAVTREDFIDQDYMWQRDVIKDPAFIAMSDPKDYTYLANQKEVGSIGQLEPVSIKFEDERLAHALQAADKEHNRNDQAFFGQLFVEVKKNFPMFTSRDVRNIQTAINGRINDFDVPDDWFEHPDKGFFAEGFDRKVEMLKELRKGSMKGLSFPEVRLEETVRYLQTMASIVNVGRERKIAALMENLEIQELARKRYAARAS